MIRALVVLVCGTFYEASCVGFVHFSKESRWKTTAMSMLAGAAEISGVFNSVRDWHVAPFYVLGLGAGAFIGVTMKSRRGEEKG